MRLLITIPLLSIMLLAGGCVGFFEKEIELEALPYERQLVLNTILFPQDSLIRADVFVTAPAVGNPPPDYPRNGRVDDARIRLEGPAGSLSFELDSFDRIYVLPQEEAQLEAGQTYEVVAEWDGLTARGQVVIPELTIPLDAIVFQDVSNDQERRTRARWPNQKGEQDYYLSFTDLIFQTKPDDIQRDLIDYIHGRDALGPEIIGSNFTDIPGPGYEKTLYVCQTTRATYDYLQTRGTLEVNDENPFAEPTTVANNMQEGLGLVGACNCWQIEF